MRLLLDLLLLFLPQELLRLRCRLLLRLQLLRRERLLPLRLPPLLPHLFLRFIFGAPQASFLNFCFLHSSRRHQTFAPATATFTAFQPQCFFLNSRKKLKKGFLVTFPPLQVRLQVFLRRLWLRLRLRLLHAMAKRRHCYN